MDVPYAREARALRRATEEAGLAANHAGKISAQLLHVDVLEKQLQSYGEEYIREVPDTSLVDELAESWEPLRDLGSEGRDDDLGEMLRARRAQLLLAQQVVTPLAQNYESLKKQLDDLQLEQVAALREPQYAEVMALLTEWSTERNAAMATLQQVLSGPSHFDPTLEMLNTAHRELLEQREQALDATDDKEAWFYTRFGLQLVDTLFGVIHDMGMSDYTTAVPKLPEQPTTADRHEMVRPLHSLEEAIGTLRQRLTQDRARYHEAVGKAREHLDEVTRRMTDLTG